MYCRNCGAKLGAKDQFCEKCGCPNQTSEQLEKNKIISFPDSNSQVKCPYCGNEACQPVVKTNVSGGYSGVGGCCGFIFLGPLGLLCGSHEVKSSNETWWNCLKCGKEFITTDEARQKIKRQAESAILPTAVCCFFTAVCFAMEEGMISCVIPIAIAAFLWYSISQIPQKEANISLKNLVGETEYENLKLMVRLCAIVFIVSAIIISNTIWGT